VRLAELAEKPAPTALRERDGTMAGQGSGKQVALWLRWIARGLGTLVAGFWVFIGILEAIFGSDPWTVESTVLALLIVAAAAAVTVAWWREGIGGSLLLLAGVAFGVFAFVAAGHNKLFAVAITGVPVLLVGLMFLASWWRFQRAHTAPS
jgi:hypothetical protein